MSTRSLPPSMLVRVRVIADYQFGRGAGEALFPVGCTVLLSRTGRVRQVFHEGKRIATVRARDGRLTLGITGAFRLHSAFQAPSLRIVVRDEVAEVIAEGKNTFCRHVIAADEEIRAGDEVLVVDGRDQLIACGSAVMSGPDMREFQYGVAVKVREGRK